MNEVQAELQLSLSPPSMLYGLYREERSSLWPVNAQYVHHIIIRLRDKISRFCQAYDRKISRLTTKISVFRPKHVTVVTLGVMRH
jgi:hypothetical protein